MPLEVDAVYENGILRPLQPLDLKEHERVVVSIAKPGSSPISIGCGLYQKAQKRFGKRWNGAWVGGSSQAACQNPGFDS
jgi:predicted DNA-binding antitoxin AbrB/MazE fold protein